MNQQVDMVGRICVVTGATRGIGKATADGLAQLGATVVLVARRVEDGEKVSQEIAARASVPPSVVTADLSEQRSIRRAAQELVERYPHIHVLINNAGVIPRQHEVTVDGFERQLAVNHLAYFLLTNLLLPQLVAGAPSRIINVSSGAHAHATIDFDDLQAERQYDPKQVYSRTKLANILFTYELSRRLRGTGVTANCLNPGVVDTGMLADYMGVARTGDAVSRTFGATPKEGAETSIFLASSPQLEGVSGKYFERKRPIRSSRQSYDEGTARRLWEVSERLTGLPS
jgi:NAD(P)-dependent dehydrogenase (short-subunit alcohol dehydrogenase family)